METKQATAKKRARAKSGEEINLAAGSLPSVRKSKILDEAQIAQISKKLEKMNPKKKWETVADLIQMKPLAQLNFLEKNGLVDSEAKTHLEKIIGKLGANDSFSWNICTQPVSKEMAGWLEANNGWTQVGSIAAKVDHAQTDYPYWGPDDPAYTSHKYEVSVSFIQ